MARQPESGGHPSTRHCVCPHWSLSSKPTRAPTVPSPNALQNVSRADRFALAFAPDDRAAPPGRPAPVRSRARSGRPVAGLRVLARWSPSRRTRASDRGDRRLLLARWSRSRTNMMNPAPTISDDQDRCNDIAHTGRLPSLRRGETARRLGSCRRPWLTELQGQDDRVPRRARGRRAGRADRAVEGGRGGGRHARADLGRGRRDPGVQPPRQGRHVHGRQDRRRTRARPTTTGSCCRAASRTPTSCAPTRTPSRFVRGFFEQAKPVGVICHGPWTLVEADVLKGRTITSWPSLQTDIRNAGGTWVDEEVVVDEGLVSLAQPGRPAGVLRQDRRGVLPRASTRASAQSVERRSARRDPRHRRHARRHQLPPRHRVVPGVPAERRASCRCGASTGTSAWAATSWSPPSPARTSTPSTATTCARPRRSLYMALIDEVARSRTRAR